MLFFDYKIIKADNNKKLEGKYSKYKIFTGIICAIVYFTILIYKINDFNQINVYIKFGMIILGIVCMVSFNFIKIYSRCNILRATFMIICALSYIIIYLATPYYIGSTNIAGPAYDFVDLSSNENAEKYYDIDNCTARGCAYKTFFSQKCEYNQIYVDYFGKGEDTVYVKWYFILYDNSLFNINTRDKNAYKISVDGAKWATEKCDEYGIYDYEICFDKIYIKINASEKISNERLNNLRNLDFKYETELLAR